MTTGKSEEPLSQKNAVKRMALVTFQAGCLTFVVAGIALGVGLLLDTRLSSFPRWTLVLLLGSAPFTMGGVYLVVKRALRHLHQPKVEDDLPGDVGNETD